VAEWADWPFSGSILLSVDLPHSRSSGAEVGPVDALQAVQVERLRGQIAFDQRRGGDAARLLLRAVQLLEPPDAGLARETHLEAIWAAMFAGDLGRPGGVREAAEAGRAAPRGPDPPRAVDVLLDAIALRFTEGYAVAAPVLTRALELLITVDARADSDEGRRWLCLAGGRASMIAGELWDFESWHALAARQVQVARDTGALVHLQFALNFLGLFHLLAGEQAATERLIAEDRLIAEATGNPPVAYAAMMLAAWQGREQEASGLIQAAVQMAAGDGRGMLADFAAYASAVLSNGLCRYDSARSIAWPAFERDHLGFGRLVAAELAEAAARTGDVTLVQAAQEWLSERTRATPTEWALGIEARVRGLASEGRQAAGEPACKPLAARTSGRGRAVSGLRHLRSGR
jgi:hypothetical protein